MSSVGNVIKKYASYNKAVNRNSGGVIRTVQLQKIFRRKAFLQERRNSSNLNLVLIHSLVFIYGML